jgi:recombination protein RecA
VKNKVAPPFKTAEFEIIYGEGVSRMGEIIDIATKLEIIEKSGSWYAFKGTKIGQGKENVKNYLKENPAISLEIEELVRVKNSLPSLKKSEDSKEKKSKIATS